MRLRGKGPEASGTGPAAKARGREALMERGLYAEWYIMLRLEEEVVRAGRYQRPLSVLIAEAVVLPGTPVRKEALESAAATASEIARFTDIIGWLGEAQIVCILPDTEPADARVAAARWQNELWRRSQHVGGQKWELRLRDDWSNVASVPSGVEDALAAANRIEAA